VNGAVKLMTAAVQKLALEHESKLGINLRKLKADAELYLDRLLSIEEAPFAPYDIDIEITDPELLDAVNHLIDHPPTPHDED
jgi:hypothetical protein